MKPNVNDVLDHMSVRLCEEIAPQLEGFHSGNAAMIGAMMKILSEHWNGAAANLLEENNAIRSIFYQAGKDLKDGDLQKLAQTVDDDIHIDALQKSNDQLRAALIDLHQSVDGSRNNVLSHINKMIWNELRESVARRSISSANF